MFDINKIINDTIAAAVSTHITEYANKMAEMAEKITALETRLLALENNPAQGVDTTLEQAAVNKDAHERQLFVLQHLTARVTALEKHTAVLDQHGGIVEYLDNQEWFWNKLRNFTDTAVEQAIENHTDMYDHSDFVTEDKLDDYVQKDSFRDEIEDVLNNATIRIRF